MDLPKPVAEYTRDEMKVLLTEGAKYDGGTPYQAAVHIFKFLDPPPAWIAPYVIVDDRHSFTYVKSMRVALVQSWGGLLRVKHWGHTERCMIEVAASFAARRKIILDEVITGNLGHAHVRVIAEAMFIRAGMDQLLAVGGTRRLDRLQAEYAGFSAGPSQDEARQAQLTDGAENRAAGIEESLAGLPPLSDLKLSDLRDPEQP